MKNKFNSGSSEIEELFKKELDKMAVESASKTTIYQINNIINKKPKYPSVQAAVEDMQQRSGYLDYLKKKATEKDNQLASDGAAEKEPEIFEEMPEIKQTIYNIISETKGLLPVPAILERLSGIYSKQKSNKLFNIDLISYVSKQNKEERGRYVDKDQNSTQLGKTDNNYDDSSENAFGLFESKI